MQRATSASHNLLHVLLYIVIVLCRENWVASLAPHLVRPISSSSEVDALAKLRYNEWIADEGVDTKTPSMEAFRRATHEIYQESVMEGSMSLLAWDSDTPVGAAELSPTQIVGASAPDAPTIYYVTDVVTARDYRRKGIALSLMKQVEAEARAKMVSYLVLHVEENNTAALRLYRERAGYSDPDKDLLRILDTDRLHENTNTWGQVLLAKLLQEKGGTQ